MTTFRDFLQWYNNKNVVPTLDAMQKMIEFYHDKGIGMLKLGCTVPNLARQNRVQTFENMVMSYFQDLKLKVSTLQENRKKLIATVLMVIATIVRLSLKPWVVISIFVLVKKLERA